MRYDSEKRTIVDVSLDGSIVNGTICKYIYVYNFFIFLIFLNIF